MEKKLKKYNIGAFLLLFVVLPMVVLSFGDFIKKSILKESISFITVLTFCLLIALFYLSQLNKSWFKAHKLSQLIKWHKAVGYTVVGIILLHPMLIVLPRFFEAGVSPWDAFLQVISSIDNSAIVSGIIAWLLILITGITSFFRNNLNWQYKTWRTFHGIMALLIVILAYWHVISIGKHSNMAMTIYYFSIAGTATFLLIKKYISKLN